MKWLGKPSPFHLFTNPCVINRFIFGQGVVIYYVCSFEHCFRSLFYSATSIFDIESIINFDLRVLTNWAKKWLVNFNQLKTEAILFTLKQFVQFPNLIFNNTLIQFVNDHKHLGLTLSNTGN